MLKALFRNLVLCEAVIGLTLFVLVLLGHTDPMTLVNTLSVVGVVMLANGLTYRPARRVYLRVEQVEQAKGLTDRAERTLRAVFQAAVVVGTGLVIYVVRTGRL